MTKTEQNVSIESVAAHPLTQVIERYCDEDNSRSIDLVFAIL